MPRFDPDDPLTLSDKRQTGCAGVVTALHPVPLEEFWNVEYKNIREALIGEAGMKRAIIETSPLCERIKKHQDDYLKDIENNKANPGHSTACGLRVVKNNFIPNPERMQKKCRMQQPYQPLLFIYVSFDARLHNHFLQ